MIFLQVGWFNFCIRCPSAARSVLSFVNKLYLPKGYDMFHFTPRYDPWKQRLCVCPDGDFLVSIARGEASMVTGTIESFTAKGLRLRSGAEVDADVVVTATGMNMHNNFPVGSINMSVDGVAYVAKDHYVYRSLALSGVPNFAFSMGYTNISWTLKSDLVSRYVCRLVNHLAATKSKMCIPTIGPEFSCAPDRVLPLESTYIMRAVDKMPKEGTRDPWVSHHNYLVDLKNFDDADVQLDMEFFK